MFLICLFQRGMEEEETSQVARRRR
ncbi:MAG: hypothetical protein E8D42_10090 [Nitrospira sp.]|nr:MAG: hypothetical protein E8D42_10090 [Nitrospira sp.]